MEGLSLLKTIKDISKNEGFFGFYKGFLSPLYSTPIINAVAFSTYVISSQMFE